MTYGFYLVIGLCLVILQTSIKTHFMVLFADVYDLIIPFVIYMGIFRSFRESLAVIIIFGLIMDSFSGGAFGLYVSVYFWIFVGVKWVMKIFQLKNTIIMMFIVAIGVLVENIILVGVRLVFQPQAEWPFETLRPFVLQLLWAICTGPIFLILLNSMHTKIERWRDKWFAEENGRSR